MTKADHCCKEHDACGHFIPRWTTKYNLMNWRPHTISSCSCDKNFLECLKEDSSQTGRDVKIIYFEVLKIPCFNIELKKVKKCVERQWYLECKKYEMKMEYFAKISDKPLE